MFGRLKTLLLALIVLTAAIPITVNASVSVPSILEYAWEDELRELDYDGFLVRLAPEAAEAVSLTEVGSLLSECDYDSLSLMSGAEFFNSLSVEESITPLLDNSVKFVTDEICRVSTLEEAKSLQKQGIVDYIEPDLTLQLFDSELDESYYKELCGNAMEEVGVLDTSVCSASDSDSADSASSTVTPNESDILIDSIKCEPDELRTQNETSYKGACWSTQVMNCSAAWDADMTGGGIKVAVIDSGIKRTHEDFITENILNGISYLTSEPTVDDTQSTYHGTFVASIIAGQVNNRNDVDGVAPGVSIQSLKIFSSATSGSLSSAIAAINYAVYNEFDVINMSFGMRVSNPEGGTYSLFAQACQDAADAGLILVSSAGNGFKNSDSTYDYTSYSYPASYNSVLSVASLASNSSAEPPVMRASSSQYNDRVFTSAPGALVRGCNNTSDTAYRTDSGTSFSAPVIAGAAALVKQQNRSITKAGFEIIVKESVIDLGDEGKDNYYGYGMIDFSKLVNCLTRTRTVSYLDCDGSQTFGIEGTSVASGSALTTGYALGIADPIELTIPSRDGFRFEGWYESNDFSGTSVSAIIPGEVSDKVYYAKWRSVVPVDFDFSEHNSILMMFAEEPQDITVIATAYDENTGRLRKVMYCGAADSTEVTIPTEGVMDSWIKKVFVLQNGYVPLYYYQLNEP